MGDLTSDQITLLVAAAMLAGGFVGWLGRGLSFLLIRWWTGSSKQEQASYLSALADLATKLRAHGMTIAEVREIERMVQDPTISSSETAAQVVEALAKDADEPEEFNSNIAMKMRAGAAYEVAESRLRQALTDLQILVPEHQWATIEKAQMHW